MCVITSFVGAAAGFALQPMIARQLLPSLGGTAAVWNTTVLFFQLVLLGGYYVTHVSATRVRPTNQGAWQFALVVLGLALLPLRVRSLGASPESESPMLWLILTLLLSVGVPYLALATTSPFVQQTFARSGHPRAGDPYFLYAASNVGSLIGLVAYPFVIEANLGLTNQRRWWSAGYVLFAACVGALVLIDRRNVASQARPQQIVIPGTSFSESDVATTIDPTMSTDPAGMAAPDPTAAAPPDWRTRLAWIGLAALPASISLGATTYLTTDVAPVPLIWALCLALYLLSYIVAFGRRSVPQPVANALAALFVGAAVTTLLVDLESTALTALCHFGLVFSVGLAYHSRLARRRPPPAHLTRFYVALSIGGIVGTMGNAIVAPLLFTRQVEYPIALVLVLVFLPTGALSRVHGRPNGSRRRRAHRAIALLAPLVGYGAVLFVRRTSFSARTLLAIVAISLIVLVTAKQRQLAAAIVAVCAVMGFRDATIGSILFSRSFYGAVHVDDVDGFHQLIHGTTTHGYQFDAAARKGVVTSYYARPGPLGRVIGATVPPATHKQRSFGVVGLGTGTIAAYLENQDRLTYFEIDRQIVDIATNRKYFTFVPDHRSAIDIVLGDGRRSLARRSQRFDVLVLDAFNSDAIPTHLLTAEAVALYRTRLTGTGVLAVHISNRFLDLEPVVGAIADRVGLASIAGHYVPTDAEEANGATASDWVFLAESEATLDGVRGQEGFAPTRRKRGVRAWTDDRIDITSILML